MAVTVTPEHERAIINRLWELGHFFNPAFFDVNNHMTEKDIEKLTLKDASVQFALRSWQDIMSQPLERFSMDIHNRPAIHDGEMGPATLATFDVPRCGVADFQKGFQAAVGFPRSCAATGISYSIGAGMPSKFKDTWADKVLGRVVLNYATFGIRLVPYTGDTPSKANIPTIFRFLPGSTIGLTYFNQGSCSDVCNCSLDSGFAPSEAAEADLVAHEWGHAIGLNHTRGGVMNPSLGSVPEPWQGFTKSDPSWATLTRLYGGEPLDPIPVPGDELEFRAGTFYVNGKEVSRLVPTGSVSYVNGDISYGGQIKGRLIMIPPA